MSEETNYSEQFTQSKAYEIAQKLGISVNSDDIKDQDALDNAIKDLNDTIRSEIKQKMEKNEELSADCIFYLKMITSKETDSEDQKVSQDREAEESENKDNKDKKETQGKEREDLSVENAQNTDNQNKNEEELSWIEKKRKIWQEYASSVEKELEEPEAKAPAKYSVGLKEIKGRVDYTSDKNAQITNDSDFLLYKGLIHDAAKGNLNLKLGDTLSASQKLMFYAAFLSSQETYPNGEKLMLIGAPELDPKSPDYKALPDEVKAILDNELQSRKKEEKTEKKKPEEKEKEQLSSIAKSLGIKELPENRDEALKQIDDEIKKSSELAGIKLEQMDTIDKREAAVNQISSQIISDLSEITGKPKEEFNKQMPISNLLNSFNTHKTIEARNLAALAHDVGYEFASEGKGTPLTQLKNMSLTDYKKIRAEIAEKAVKADGWKEQRDAVYGASLANAFKNARGGR